MKPKLKKSRHLTSCVLPTEGRAWAQLRDAHVQLESLGKKHRQLLLAYQEVLEELNEMGMRLTYEAVHHCDPQSSDFELGLMTMDGTGPLYAVGCCHDLLFRLLAGEHARVVDQDRGDDIDCERPC